MPDRVVVRPQARERLEKLYQRHRDVPEEAVTKYYGSGRGYYGSEEAGEEKGRFALCLATIDGEVFVIGDHDRALRPPIDLEGLRVRARAGGPRPRGRPRARRRRAQRRRLQLDRLRRAEPPPAQPDGQRGRAGDDRPGRVAATTPSEARAHPRDPAPLRRQRGARGRRADVPQRDADGRSQPRHRLPDAQPRRCSRATSRRCSALYLQQCSVHGDLPRPGGDGRDARERLREPRDRRARASPRSRAGRAQRDAHLRHVRRRRPVDVRGRGARRRAA